MKKFIFLLASLVSMSMPAAGRISYTADETSIFPNPERGFTEELGGETKLSDSKNHVVQPEADWYFDLDDPDNADRKTQTLVMLMYYLYNYRSKDLSDKMLQGFDEDMQILRDKGFKCVLRFAYDWNSNTDADLTHVQRHIAQLKPHLAKNADVIYVLETGFVGQWGEWYYSTNYGNESQHLNNNRRAVLTAMLDACPSDRFLLVRYPLIKTEYLGDETALTAEQAFTGTTCARIGHHNDAFLNKYGNDGTYGRDGDGPEDDPVLRQYIADETLYVPNGGETNVESSSLAKKVYAQAESEMSTYHWSFCGSTYAEAVTKKWRENGIFANLDRKMGYRYEMVSADLPATVQAGGTARIEIAIKNVGYAPLYNARPVYLVLRNQQSDFSLQLAADPRRWLPNGVTTTVSETVTIPADIPAGTYSLYLHMPDAYASLAADPRYAVRFANVGTWDAATGMNSLLSSLEVQSSASGLEDLSAPSTSSHPTTARKLFRNGHLLILRDGHTYTPTGQELR